MVGAAQLVRLIDALALFLVLPAPRLALASSESNVTAAVDIQPSATASECEARTINYITHTLPQYCLTSTWTSPSATPTPTQPPRPDANDTVASASSASERSQPDAPVTAALDDFPVEAPATPQSTATSFMSFEDWKEMMLRQAGQDPQDLRQRRQKEHSSDDRAPPDLSHSDLGEEDEISLNFDAYTDAEPESPNETAADGDRDSDGAVARQDGDDPAAHRSKDAGKTCKERFSYSSFDAGATILKTSPGAKNARAILVENKDSYMLLECNAASKFVIVELSDDVLVDTIVLANFEFFSSMVRHFRLSVSDRYPVKMDKWRDLGTFEARNSRDIQAFLVENPQIWAKYVRIEFLTHFGKEYYCPVSLLRVHGSRLLDSWKDTENESAPDDEALLQDWRSAEVLPDAPDDPVIPPVADHGAKSDQATGQAEEKGAVNDVGKDEVLTVQDTSPWPTSSDADLFTYPAAICAAPTPVGRMFVAGQPDSSRGGSDTAPVNSTSDGDARRSAAVPVGTQDPDPSRDATSSAPSSTSAGSSSASSGDQPGTVSSDSSVNSTTSTAGEAGASTTAPANKTSAASNGAGGKARSTGTSSGAAASPTVQQGFFNAITQRLQQVEANLTLSLKYVEDQSRHMQDALQRVEQKQSSKVSLYLEDLNRTVLAELRSVRDQYEQIWQSTIIALDSQRDHSERDIVALSTRLNILADEVVFQKRMAIVQAVLLLSCLFLVIFSRGVPIPYLAPLLEQNAAATYMTSPTAAPPSARILYPARTDSRRGDSGISYVSQRGQEPPPALNGHVGINLPPSSDNLSPVPEVDPEPTRDSPDYEHLSPPLTPSSTHPDDPDSERLSHDPDAGSSRHPPGVQFTHARKPLPALPENPGSP